MSTPGTTSSPHAPSALDRYFEITARGSTVAREVRGGVVTFLTMAYIIVLNPLILGLVPDSTGAYLGGGSCLLYTSPSRTCRPSRPAPPWWRAS